MPFWTDEPPPHVEGLCLEQGTHTLMFPGAWQAQAVQGREFLAQTWRSSRIVLQGQPWRKEELREAEQQKRGTGWDNRDRLAERWGTQKQGQPTLQLLASPLAAKQEHTLGRGSGGTGWLTRGTLPGALFAAFSFVFVFCFCVDTRKGVWGWSVPEVTACM